MLDLKDLSYFVNVVDRGGFSAAGRSLRIPKSTLSHRIQQLEASLGVRLVNRTSRRFGVTEIGRDFYQNAIATLLQAEHTEASIRQHLSEPSGALPGVTRHQATHPMGSQLPHPSWRIPEKQACT